MTGKRACQLLCILLLFIMKKLFTNHLRGQTIFKYKLGIGCYRDNSLLVITFLNNLGKRKFQKKKMKMRTRKVMKKMAKKLMRELPKITPWQGQLKKCFLCEWFFFCRQTVFIYMCPYLHYQSTLLTGRVSVSNDVVSVWWFNHSSFLDLTTLSV